MDACCPKFNVKKWNKKTLIWKNKKFITESIPQLFHIPFFPMIGWSITRMWNKATLAKASVKSGDTLVLFNDPNPFRSDIFLAVSNTVPDAKNVTVSGTFYCEVFDGGYGEIPKFIGEIEKSLKKKKAKALDYYVHYAYCPKCIKKYGHNYILLLAKLK